MGLHIRLKSGGDGVGKALFTMRERDAGEEACLYYLTSRSKKGAEKAKHDK